MVIFSRGPRYVAPCLRPPARGRDGQCQRVHKSRIDCHQYPCSLNRLFEKVRDPKGRREIFSFFGC